MPQNVGAKNFMKSHLIIYLISCYKGPSINNINILRILATPLPHVNSFLVLSVGKFHQFLTPPPDRIADFIYGRPLIKIVGKFWNNWIILEA